MIYGLVDPRTDKVRYIGQSLDPERRFKLHVSRPHSKGLRTWVGELSRAGAKPVLRILAEQGAERDWIEQMSPDLNVMEGKDADHPPRRARPKPRVRDHVLPPVRVTEDEKDEIRRLADAAMMTVAEYLRRRALREECPAVVGAAQ